VIFKILLMLLLFGCLKRSL